jgi:L-malate glycosyltransferase
MKVLHILDSLNRGGAEILELDVCRNAKKNGLDLIFAATGGGDLEEDFSASGVEFIRLQRKLPIDISVVSKLRQLIKSQQIKVIHTNQPVEGIHAYLAALRTKTKVVLSHHGLAHDSKNRWALKFLIPRVAKNVYVSESLRQWYFREAKINANANYAVVYNGVDEKRLAYSGENLKSELKLPDDAFLFGIISNFYAEPRKDQITLCKAFAKIAEKLPQAHLVLVGKVEAGAETKFADCVQFCEENNLSDKTHFLGLRKDIPKILNSLDIFVLSSLHEGMPIAAMEAMLTRKPCVFSDIEPLLEVSKNGEFAEMFQTQNADDLAKKLIKLTGNVEFRKDLANRAYDFAKRTFSIEAHIGSLKNLYESIV